MEPGRNPGGGGVGKKISHCLCRPPPPDLVLPRPPAARPSIATHREERSSVTRRAGVGGAAGGGGGGARAAVLLSVAPKDASPCPAPGGCAGGVPESRSAGGQGGGHAAGRGAAGRGAALGPGAQHRAAPAGSSQLRTEHHMVLRSRGPLKSDRPDLGLRSRAGARRAVPLGVARSAAKPGLQKPHVSLSAPKPASEPRCRGRSGEEGDDGESAEQPVPGTEQQPLGAQPRAGTRRRGGTGDENRPQKSVPGLG